MRRPVVLVAAVGVFGLAVLMLLIALNLLPTGAEAEERGTYAAWMVTWIMVWTTIISGLVLGGYLLMAGLGAGGRSTSGAVVRAGKG